MPCARSGARSQSRTNPNGHIFCAPCPPERSPPPPRAASCVASSCHAFTVPRDMGLRAGRPPPRARCTGAWDVSGLAAVEFHRLVRSPLGCETSLGRELRLARAANFRAREVLRRHVGSPPRRARHTSTTGRRAATAGEFCRVRRGQLPRRRAVPRRVWIFAATPRRTRRKQPRAAARSREQWCAARPRSGGEGAVAVGRAPASRARCAARPHRRPLLPALPFTGADLSACSPPLARRPARGAHAPCRGAEPQPRGADPRSLGPPLPSRSRPPFAPSQSRVV